MSTSSPTPLDDPPQPSGGSPGRAEGDRDQSPITSPSPQKGGTATILGIGSPSLPSIQQSTSVLATYPHLAHYIFNLLHSVQPSPSPIPTPPQHPLSVSSSGESDGSDSGDEDTNGTGGQRKNLGDGQQTPQKAVHSKLNGNQSGNGLDRDGLVRKVVQLLDNEEEDEVKDLLRAKLGDLGKDEILMDQICLDCMHRRKDDVDQVPYNTHLTPTRARASPALVSHPLRPYTPTRVPSLRARTPLGRPQSPVTSLPLPTSHSSSGRARPDPSPTLAPGTVAPSSSSSYGSTGSPVSSPRMLNAKAAMFSPSPRTTTPIPAVSSTSATFSPSDPWRDMPAESPRSASPFGAISAPGMVRTGSNLAIAAPLLSGDSSPFHSPIGTPSRGFAKMPDVFVSSGITVQRSSSRGLIPEDDDDDEFSPFGSGLPRLHHQQPLSSTAKAFEPFGSNNDYQSGTSSLSSSMTPSDPSTSFDSRGSRDSSVTAPDLTADELNQVSAGMTPLDVLCSVFTSIPPSELEDALHRAGYDFEGAMAILVQQHTLPRSGSSTPQRVSSPRPLLGVGSRGPMPIGHQAPRDGYFQQGGRSFAGNVSPGVGGVRSPGPGGSRMCRYYLAGECRRSDCRFSHDIDRALCRFWLRGHCAKGPNCEFLHHLPNNMDPNALSSAMSRVELSSDGTSRPSTPPVGYPSSGVMEEFPDLLAARLGRPASRFDPSRNRFANAVKRAGPGPIVMPSINVTGHGGVASRLSPGPPYSPGGEARTPSAIPVPRPSARIKLRAPTLLPTLKTGSAVNDQYLQVRSQAIRLGHARNACLARAADAFRRGDGAAAKRFSREGKTLNERMLSEAADAAQHLMRERRQEAQKVIRERDPNWSDDVRDRSERGKECAGGLGVVMGVASARGISGGNMLSSEERMECLLDLHTLHGNEGTDILGQFLAELERENYRGLAYIIVGEEKHVGTQDPGRGASKIRLSASVKQCLAEWGYPWSEGGGVVCVDPCRF